MAGDWQDRLRALERGAPTQTELEGFHRQLARATQEAQAAEQRDFDIPPQALASALRLFGRQSGLQVAADSGLLAGLQAPGLQGRYLPEEALRRLLLDTGVTFRFSGDDTVTLEPVVARQNDGTLRLGPVMVEGELDPLAPPATGTIGSPPPAFPGGQVATGQQLGLLGNRDRLETPLSTTSVTADLIQNQQATDSYQVIQSLPSLQSYTSPNQGVTFIQSRGVEVSSSAIGFDGITNLFSDTQPSLVGIERIESLRGPTALFSGLSSPFLSVAGGVVNFVPKRATTEDVTSVTAGYQSDAIGYGQFDFGRRFGKENELGLRLGGEYLGGDTQADFNERRQRGVALALDYNKDALRAVLDLRYNEVEQDGPTREFSSVAGPTIPTNFDADTNNNQPWAFLDQDTLLGALRVEYDLLSETTAFAVASGAIHNRSSSTGVASSLQPNGDFTTNVISFRDDGNLNGNLEGGLRSRFTTGPVSHTMVAAVNYGVFEERFALAGFDPAQAFQNNIFDPIVVPDPDIQVDKAVGPTLEVELFGITLADTFGFFNDRLQVTAGVRYQDIKIENFSAITGDRTSLSEGSRYSPGVGVLFRVNDGLSVYANYLEGLSSGGTAPLTAANPGEQLGPIVSDSIEVGAKFNIGTIGVDAALFQIRDTTSGVDQNTNIFGEVGENRIRGLEVTAFGEIVGDLRLLGGATFYDSEITESGNPENVGQDGPGIPDYVLALGLEYDVPKLHGLTLTGGVRHQGEAKVALGNDVEIPAWTTVDLGARYSFDRYTARFGVENLFDETYFNGRPFGGLVLGLPRTFLASVSADF
ncbi:TonB-dependent siderophore receptor [Algihabitans sp.]|uniref:TonB-dependent siderophore receptor n=1 Tax=Algihabitans sp. TaxID=2821514 RepID=UPI003BABA237